MAKRGIESTFDSKILSVSRINVDGTCPIWSYMTKDYKTSTKDQQRVAPTRLAPKSEGTENFKEFQREFQKSFMPPRHLQEQDGKDGGNVHLAEHIQVEGESFALPGMPETHM